MRKPRGVERLCIDFDSFFATAEQHLRPQLRGRPVGVILLEARAGAGVGADRGRIVIAIEPHGIRTPAPLNPFL